MIDIMLDLETVSNTADSAIVAIGAVQFNPITGKTGSEFNHVIDMQSSLDIGGRITADTLYWWMKQNKEARAALDIPGKINIQHAADKWRKYVQAVSGNAGVASTYNVRLWGNGASFDNTIWRHTHFLLGKTFPVAFWNDRDVRTIMGLVPYKFFGAWKDANPRTGTYHNALDDAKYQVKYMSYVLSELGATEIH